MRSPYRESAIAKRNEMAMTPGIAALVFPPAGGCAFPAMLLSVVKLFSVSRDEGSSNMLAKCEGFNEVG